MEKLRVLCIVVLCILSTSCSESGPKLAKIDGVISVNGKPLAMGKIMMSSALGRQTVGDVVDGKIKNVTTFSTGDGAVVGENRVAVRPSVDESMMMKEPNKAARAITSAGIPKKFYSLSTTELTFDVKPGQTNSLNINIKAE